MGFCTISGHVYRRVQMFSRWISLFFFFFFSFSLPRRCVFFGLFAALFFFPLLPKVHLIPDFPLVLLVSCLLNVPESLFFSLALTHPRGIHVLAARARGGKDRPTRRAVHPILRRPDKWQLQFPFEIYRISLLSGRRIVRSLREITRPYPYRSFLVSFRWLERSMGNFFIIDNVILSKFSWLFIALFPRFNWDWSISTCMGKSRRRKIDRKRH